jgi:hypothetical protein
MKTKCLRASVLLMAAGGLVLVSGCVVQPNGQVSLQLPVIAVAPTPVMVPDSYVWDGFEYVGVVGGAYFYLGPGNVWLGCEPWRLDRFHEWERGHPDWRNHAIRNDHFRNAGHGYGQARHDEHEKLQTENKKQDEKKKEDDHH